MYIGIVYRLTHLKGFSLIVNGFLSIVFAHMRPSPFRHPLAVLRTILGLSQEEFGREIKPPGRQQGLSRRTIQAIELGKLRLTEENALLIQQKTGVSVHWLLEGNTAIEPYMEDVDGRHPYTKEIFDRIKAHEASGIESVYPESTPSRLHVEALATMHDWFPILSSANKNVKGELVVYYLHKFLGEMREQFGYDSETADKISDKAKLIEPDGSEFLFDYSGGPGVLTQVKGKSGFKFRRKSKDGSPKKPERPLP